MLSFSVTNSTKVNVSIFPGTLNVDEYFIFMSTSEISQSNHFTVIIYSV